MSGKSSGVCISTRMVLTVLVFVKSCHYYFSAKKIYIYIRIINVMFGNSNENKSGVLTCEKKRNINSCLAESSITWPKQESFWICISCILSHCIYSVSFSPICSVSTSFSLVIVSFCFCWWVGSGISILMSGCFCYLPQTTPVDRKERQEDGE